MIILAGAMHGGTSLIASMLTSGQQATVMIENRLLLTEEEHYIELDNQHKNLNRPLINKITIPLYPMHSLEQLKTVYGGKFAFIFRHPIDAILSSLDRGGQGIHWGIYWNNWLIDIAFKHKQKYPDETYIFKYEDLIAEPEQTLIPLCDFLGMTYTDKMLEFEMVNHHFKKAYGNKLCRKNAYKFATDPRQQLVRKIYNQTAPHIVKAGYSEDINSSWG